MRIVVEGKVKRQCRTFGTTTAELEALRDWITSWGCTLVAMEATGLGGAFEMNIANAREGHAEGAP